MNSRNERFLWLLGLLLVPFATYFVTNYVRDHAEYRGRANRCAVDLQAATADKQDLMAEKEMMRKEIEELKNRPLR